jgi:hypothetical protein
MISDFRIPLWDIFALGVRRQCSTLFLSQSLRCQYTIQDIQVVHLDHAYPDRCAPASEHT